MNDELRNEVLRRKYGGQSGRDIARDLHLSRKTVAKVLAEHRQPVSYTHLDVYKRQPRIHPRAASGSATKLAARRSWFSRRPHGDGIGAGT